MSDELDHLFLVRVYYSFSYTFSARFDESGALVKHLNPTERR